MFVFTLSSTIFSQSGTVGLRYGFGTYSMNSLGALQESLASASGLPLESTESYPSAPNYRIEIAYNPDKFISKLGIFYVFNSTGARSTVSDYSGKAYLDAIINGNQFGLTSEHIFKRFRKMELSAYLEGSFISSKLNIEDKIEIYDGNYTSSDNYLFVSRGIAAEAGLSLQYYILKFLRLKFNLGYLADISGPLYLKDNKNDKLTNEGEEVKPQWSGLRTGFQIDFIIK
jgi:hypothetical protein